MADHSFRVALFALVASSSSSQASSSPSSSPPFDAARAVKIALVHDLAEAIVGDIAPGDNGPKEEKARREAEAMAEMRRMLEGGGGSGGSGSSSSPVTIGAEVEALFEEYEKGETPEAQLVKDCDKLEMLLQAVEYEKEESPETPNLDLSEFFEGVRGKLKTEIGRNWALEIEGRRPKRG